MWILDEATWRARARAHEARVDALVAEHLDRRRDGVKHPVHDFLFTYYSFRPAQLRRWHPGVGVALENGEVTKGYRVVSPTTRDGASSPSRLVAADVTDPHRRLAGSIHRLLLTTANRPAHFGCFGLHEWAMVHRAEETRHDWPLRLGAEGTDRVVESHRIACSHFDAFRFFTDSARPLNTLRPGRDDRPDFEQSACLHAGMDLYKHAFRLTPLVPSHLVADCFELARDIRVVDMQAAPYDLADLGFDPIRIETAEGKQEYVARQRAFVERGAPLRQRLVEHCERIIES